MFQSAPSAFQDKCWSGPEPSVIDKLQKKEENVSDRTVFIIKCHSMASNCLQYSEIWATNRQAKWKEEISQRHIPKEQLKVTRGHWE